MGWSFAKVNGKLSEIYFEQDEGIMGYCEVERSDYKTEKEKKWIEEDLKKYDFIYKGGVYKNKIDGKELPSLEPPEITEEDIKNAKPFDELVKELEDN